MSKKEIIAYAITHAPKGVKGGPYEAHGACGTPAPSLDKAMQWHDRPSVSIYGVRKVVPHARVICIVRKARPSEAREVLRELVAWWEGSGPPCHMGDLIARARAVLAASGPDPMPVVRAALAEEQARVRMARAEHGIGDFAALETAWLKRAEATRVAVKAYRKDKK